MRKLQLPPLLLISLLAQLCLLASAVSAQNNPRNINFSGHWEIDYSDSDNIQQKLDTEVRELRRQYERAQAGNMNSRQSAAMSMGGGGYNSGESVIGLARMADDITESQLLEITQSAERIVIKREQTFALTCDFYDSGIQTVDTPFAREICGWDSHQLVFRVLLPEGLSILHRLSLAASGQRLNIATTVTSDRVSFPFTVNRVYNRYQPGSGGFHCEQTLTRGKVCTTRSAP